MIRILFILLIVATLGFSQNIGQPVPDFTLTDLDGNQHTLSDYKGKVVYIFWFGYS